MSAFKVGTVILFFLFFLRGFSSSRQFTWENGGKCLLWWKGEGVTLYLMIHIVFPSHNLLRSVTRCEAQKPSSYPAIFSHFDFQHVDIDLFTKWQLVPSTIHFNSFVGFPHWHDCHFLTHFQMLTFTISSLRIKITLSVSAEARSVMFLLTLLIYDLILLL